MSAHNSIIILGAGRALQFEAKANEAGIYPGHLVERSSDTTFLRCNANGTAAAPLIAIENSINGKDKDTVYANGETVYARALVPGMEVQVKVAPSASAIVYGDLLTPDGDGGVKKAVAASQLGSGVYTYTPASVSMFRAIEAVDNSANAATSVFIKAQKI
jgi:hypothetical protein